MVLTHVGGAATRSAWLARTCLMMGMKLYTKCGVENARARTHTHAHTHTRTHSTLPVQFMPGIARVCGRSPSCVKRHLVAAGTARRTLCTHYPRKFAVVHSVVAGSEGQTPKLNTKTGDLKAFAVRECDVACYAVKSSAGKVRFWTARPRTPTESDCCAMHRVRITVTGWRKKRIERVDLPCKAWLLRAGFSSWHIHTSAQRLAAKLEAVTSFFADASIDGLDC